MFGTTITATTSVCHKEQVTKEVPVQEAIDKALEVIKKNGEIIFLFGWSDGGCRFVDEELTSYNVSYTLINSIKETAERNGLKIKAKTNFDPYVTDNYSSELKSITLTVMKA